MSLLNKNIDLNSIATDYAQSYSLENPFPHVVLDGIFDLELLRQVALEFPENGWQQLNEVLQKKLSISDMEKMGPNSKSVINELNSQEMVFFLQKLTGIQGLVPDPNLTGGGLHQIKRGGFLEVHADFNKHSKLKLDRRVNLLLYLNDEWDETYGGHLELWDKSMSLCVKRVLPIIGRCVIFSTTSDAPHGHPHPLNCPEDRSRRSIALYYYTNGRPKSERRAAHSTIFFKSNKESGSLPFVRNGLMNFLIRFVRFIPKSLLNRIKGFVHPSDK